MIQLNCTSINDINDRLVAIQTALERVGFHMEADTIPAKDHDRMANWLCAAMNEIDSVQELISTQSGNNGG